MALFSEIDQMSSMSDNNSPSVPNVATTAASEVKVCEPASHKIPHKPKSDVWDHFTKDKRVDGGKPQRAKCNYCHIDYACASMNGTSTLRKHLTKCPKYVHNNKKQKLLVFSGQEEDNSIGNWKFDQELCRQALAKMIVVDELPFKFVQHERFRNFCNILQPRFKLMSRTTVTKDYLALYMNKKRKLKDFLLKNVHRVCLTTNCWTSIQNMGYMCLTAHFIDNDWKLQKMILNFAVVTSHSGQAIAQAVELCLLNWDLKKVCTITVDNASSNDVAVEKLRRKLLKRTDSLIFYGEYLHMRCSAHIINLIVKDGLKEMKDSINRIRGAVRYIRSSPARALQFKGYIEQERIACKSALVLDVSTRWNSSYFMLDAALKFQKAFERLEEQETQFEKELKDGPPIEEDWENAKALNKFLKIFYDATRCLSGSLYVTSNSYFHEICGILSLLNKCLESWDSFLHNMAIKMKEKFDKYWGSIDKLNILLLIAVVLDPRFKLKYVKFCYSQIYHPTKVLEMMKKVKEALERIFSHYKDLDSSSSSPPINITEHGNEMEVDQHCDDNCVQVKFLQSEFLKHMEEEESMQCKSELDRYLKEGNEKESSEFEILVWWKLNSQKYKVLSKVARDVLAIPVSTVASESAFSTGGQVLDQFRSSLTPKLVECLICAQDWLRVSPSPIDIEEKLKELEEVESGITEEPELVVGSF